MILDAEQFKKRDVEKKQRADARNNLEDFCEDLKLASEAGFDWLEGNKDGTIEHYNTRKQELTQIYTNIMQKYAVI